MCSVLHADDVCMDGRSHHFNGDFVIAHCSLDTTQLIVTIAEAVGAGVAFIIGLVLISTCVCYGFKKRKQNMKQAASVTNRNPTFRNDYTDVHIKRDVMHFENKTYGCDSLEECK